MNDAVDRRRFLRQGAAASAALGLATIAHPAAVAARTMANDRLHVGVIGTGGRGMAHAGLLAKLSDVVVSHVCDVDEKRMANAASVVEKATGRKPLAVGDLRKMFDDQSLDAVVVATCNHWHAPAALLACAAGKHVYVEKPCSHNAREGELLVEAARTHKKHVQMGNQRRSWPSIMEAVKLVQGGAIGNAYLAQCWYRNDRPTIGKVGASEPPAGLNYDLWQGPAPRRPYHANYLPYNWHWFWHWGNGELGNNGVHYIDVCRWGLGVDFPTGVASIGGRYRFDDDQETPDVQSAKFEFAGRKTIMYECASCTPAKGPEFDILFHGDRGTLGIRGSTYVVFDANGKESARKNHSGGDLEHVGNFLDAVRGRGQLNSPIDEGHKSTLLCHLGNIAYRTGRGLKCDPANGRIVGDDDAAKQWSREYEHGWEPKV
jgi:predicted dehydrogenase